MDQKRHHLQGDRAATEQLLDEYIDYLMAHSDSAHPAWNLEMIRSWKSNKWNYIDGCMITGILERYEITGEARFLDFADRFLSGFVQEDGLIRTYDPAEYSLDNVNPAKNLFTLYDLTGKEKYRKALELVRSQLSTMPRTPEGNFWHKLIYPNQVWLDGIYMALPFYMEYEKRFDAQKDCEDICRQIANVEIRMRDPKTGLYYHGYDASRKMYWADPDTGCSPNFWLRAEGWFILGLVDVLEIMKDLPMGAESVHLQHMLLDLAKARRRLLHAELEANQKVVPETVVKTGVHQKVHEVALYLQTHIHESVSLAELAQRFFMSRSYLTRSFRNVTGFSVVEYMTYIRIQKAQQLLREADRSITEIADLCGFGNITYFEKVFKTTTGHTPVQYRKTVDTSIKEKR